MDDERAEDLAARLKKRAMEENIRVEKLFAAVTTRYRGMPGFDYLLAIPNFPEKEADRANVKQLVPEGVLATLAGTRNLEHKLPGYANTLAAVASWKEEHFRQILMKVVETLNGAEHM